jgi:biopolymer transport protein ExbD
MAGDFTGGGGGGGRKSLDVDINLVPFIDMMSVLVAFLLLTAVWTNLAQINIKPGGVGHSDEPPPTQPPVNLSLLVAQDGVWVGVSGTTGEQPRHIDKIAEAYDWAAVDEALHHFKKDSGFFTDRDDIEIAAEDKVDYQSIITAMDHAVADEFKGIRYVDPTSLSARFKQ